MKNNTRVPRVITAAIVASAAAVGLVAVGTSASAGQVQDPCNFTVEALRVDVKPWQTVKIPTTSCGEGAWLNKAHLSPNRSVPNGVHVSEPGGIGVHINQSLFRSWVEDDTAFRGDYGINGAANVISSATNWDPIFSHELVVTLHCTTDPNEASIYPWAAS